MRGQPAGKVASITGSDPGIGQAAPAGSAGEGAGVVVRSPHDQHGAERTRSAVAELGRRAVVVPGELSVQYQGQGA